MGAVFVVNVYDTTYLPTYLSISSALFSTKVCRCLGSPNTHSSLLNPAILDIKRKVMKASVRPRCYISESTYHKRVRVASTKSKIKNYELASRPCAIAEHTRGHTIHTVRTAYRMIYTVHIVYMYTVHSSNIYHVMRYICSASKMFK